MSETFDPDATPEQPETPPPAHRPASDPNAPTAPPPPTSVRLPIRRGRRRDRRNHGTAAGIGHRGNGVGPRSGCRPVSRSATVPCTSSPWRRSSPSSLCSGWRSGRKTIQNQLGNGSPLVSLPSSGAAETGTVASKVDPGVVDITTRLGFSGGEAAGTGMVLNTLGDVLTNNHVIDGATSITVTDVGNGETYTGAGGRHRQDPGHRRLEALGRIGACGP